MNRCFWWIWLVSSLVSSASLVSGLMFVVDPVYELLGYKLLLISAVSFNLIKISYDKWIEIK